MLGLSVIAGASAAACFGIADFVVAGVSRVEGWRRTLLGAQALSLPILAVFAWGYGGWDLGVLKEHWGWVLGFGAAHLLGSVALYRGLEVGVVSVVSPLAGTFGAVTAILAVFLGAPMTTALGLALFSVVAGSMLAARSTVEGGSVKSTPRVEHLGAPEVGAPWVRGAGWGLLSAVALGISFFGLDFLGGHGAPIALTVGSYRLLTALGLGALTVARGGVADAGSTDGEGHGLIGSLGRWTFLGLLDAGGMLVYAWGCARGEVAVVAVVASLFPALTVSLAHWRMGERLSRWQWVGLGWMFAGLIAVAWLQGP